jgi:hypothetical protein
VFTIAITKIHCLDTLKDQYKERWGFSGKRLCGQDPGLGDAVDAHSRFRPVGIDEAILMILPTPRAFMILATAWLVK